MDRAELRVGCVQYLNARPLIEGWPGVVEFDHPSVLCRKLARGEFDVALVSSIEYLRRPGYRIVDGVSIAAFGPVYSVIVAHREERSAPKQIEIDPASETSVALLRCLLAHHQMNPCLRRTTGGQATPLLPPENSELQPASARLLIGDQAIRFRQANPEYRVWDLGEEWKKVTDLPFVFALWLVRPEVAQAETMADRLRTLRDQNMQRIEELSATQPGYTPEFCRQYFGENLRFDFGPAEKAGLREFHRRCRAVDLDVAPWCEPDIV